MPETIYVMMFKNDENKVKRFTIRKGDSSVSQSGVLISLAKVIDCEALDKKKYGNPYTGSGNGAVGYHRITTTKTPIALT